MEKNWIKDVIEFVRKAMNKGLLIKGYKCSFCIEENKLVEYYDISIEDEIAFRFYKENGKFELETPKGRYKSILNLTKRDFIELDSLVLSIEEYSEDMAISEFNNYFGEEENKVVNINDLDNDDD